MKKRLVASIMGVVALALLSVAAGCGSSDDESLTKAEYVRKGNAICGKWQQARGEMFNRLNQELKPPVTQAKKEKAILVILEPYETATEELSELSPPEGEEKKVESIVGAMEDGLEEGKASPATLISSEVPFKKANQLAEAYGLTECKA